MGFQATNAMGGEVRVQLKNIGDSTEGYYIKKDSFQLRGDTLSKHLLQNDDGETVSVIGGKVMDAELAKVEPGTRVRITFGGKGTTKNGKPYNKYTVEFDADDTIDVSGQE